MPNPFQIRATEFIRDTTSFLSIVSPEPLLRFLVDHERINELLTRPVRIIGSPGTGKTMLATLAEFGTIERILEDLESDTNRELTAALTRANFIKDAEPLVAAVRVPIESEYRDLWELPYEDDVKTRLTFRLIQARAIIGLLRNLTASGERTLDDVRLVPRADHFAQVDQIGGIDIHEIRRRAFEVERAIYNTGSALVPPKLEELTDAAQSPYAPFDAIEAVEITWSSKRIRLNPLAMLDDIHELHHDQLDSVAQQMVRREMRFGRWMMMRLDALSSRKIILESSAPAIANRSHDRDFIDVPLQPFYKTKSVSVQFKRIAKDIANKYLPMVATLRNREALAFNSLLSTTPQIFSSNKLEKLKKQLDKDQKNLKISDAARSEIEINVEQYLEAKRGRGNPSEIPLAMVRILLHRYDKRRRNRTSSLFEADGDLEPTVEPVATSGVVHGASSHLHLLYQRPVFFGFDTLCEISNQNAEIFLGYAGALVAEVETRAIRGKSLVLDPLTQQSVMFSHAQKIMGGWAFPYASQVKALVTAIGQDCMDKTLEPNAPLNGGANAIGIAREEFDRLDDHDALLQILKYALGYNVINLLPNYNQGNKKWVLIELGGTACVAYGLTLARGGFLQKNIRYLREAIDGA